MSRHRTLVLAGVLTAPARREPIGSLPDEPRPTGPMTAETRARVLALLAPPPDIDDPDAEGRAVLDALERFEQRREPPLRIPRGFEGGGRFRSLADTVFKALADWAKGDGPDDPFKGVLDPDPVKRREQIRRVAKARGIEPRRGASYNEIANQLLDQVRGDSDRPRVADGEASPGKPAAAKKAMPKVAKAATPKAAKKAPTDAASRPSGLPSKPEPGDFDDLADFIVGGFGVNLSAILGDLDAKELNELARRFDAKIPAGLTLDQRRAWLAPRISSEGVRHPGAVPFRSDDLSSLSRAELVALAGEVGVPNAGRLNMRDLREEITAAREREGAAVGRPKELSPTTAFDQSKAKTYRPVARVKHARVMDVPDGKTTTITPEWGGKQRFRGRWVAVLDDESGEVAYGSAYDEWVDTHERVPGEPDGWRKTATVDAYQHVGEPGTLTTVLADGTEETENTVNPGDWVVRQKNGELQVIPDRDFRRLYDVSAPRKAAPAKAARADPPGYPRRAKVPARDWDVPAPGYDPPEYTAPGVLVDPRTGSRPTWADPPDVADVGRVLAGHEGPARLDADGRPLNPRGRTGLRGRGALGRWGPNFAADPIVTRVDPRTGRLQVISVRRADSGSWALPGGMDEGEGVLATLMRELREEAGAAVDLSAARVVYRGYVNDPRNTDNAWMETTAARLHLPPELAAMTRLAGPEDPAEISGVRWADVDQDLLSSLYANHADFVRAAVAEMLTDEALPAPERARLAALVSTSRPDPVASTSAMLKDQVDAHGLVDVGAGVERHLGISRNRLDQAIDRLVADGYEIHNVQIDQVGGGAGKTTVKTLARPGTGYREVKADRNKIRAIVGYSDDRGRTYEPIRAPLSIDSRRLKVNYAEDGGDRADGVVYVRPGVEDLSLGGARYAQVRIAIDGSHYIKGMAVYRDDLPEGVDLVFNTKKSDTGNKLDALKPLQRDRETGEVDPDLPFGTVIRRQITADDGQGGKRVASAMNLVYEEGSWSRWSRSLSSQVLSKQSPELARAQLGALRSRRRAELDQILKIDQPVVRRKLLGEYAEAADSAAVDLSAAALPRQSWRVILPEGSLAENEVYAPGYRDGERVVLIRHPHAGTFEIPELVVNNSNEHARRLLGDAPDAVAINPAVAARLSGADFDGDTVLVIPNEGGDITTTPALAGLADFDPSAAYPARPGAKPMSKATEEAQMGMVSNLITDMTIQGASLEEITRAVRHSMVVIDARKHKLDYRRSAEDHGIAELRAKYQGGGGASTLISRASSEAPAPATRPRGIDPATGRLITEPILDAQGNPRTRRVERLAVADDARALISDADTEMERIYAEHSNELKALANQARRELAGIGTVKKDPVARRAYADEVAALTEKLNLALMNAPVEREAQRIANAIVERKRAAAADLPKAELAAYMRKVEAQALRDARERVQAGKTRIHITDEEWEAIRAGALSDSMLSKVLANADPARLRALAIPKPGPTPTPTLRPPTRPVDIHQLMDASDAEIEATLRDVYEGQFGPYTTKVTVSVTRAGTRTTKTGRVVTIEPSIHVGGKIYDSAGAEIGDFGRSIGPVELHYGGEVRREMWAEHHIIQLKPRFQGKGFGGAFNRRVIQWYRESGVHGVYLTDHNGYTWASQGFGFNGGIVPDTVTEALREMIDDLRAGRTRNKHGETIPKRLREAADLQSQIAAAEALLERLARTTPGQPDYPTAYEISQLGRSAGQRGKTATWLGKEIWVPASEMILNPDEGTVISGGA